MVVPRDLNLAARCCDELVLPDAGRVVAAGTADVVLRPAVLEPVHGIGVERIVTEGSSQLLFRPLGKTPDKDSP